MMIVQVAPPPNPTLVWLFNLAEDPTETTNLAEQYPEIVCGFNELLISCMMLSLPRWSNYATALRHTTRHTFFNKRVLLISTPAPKTLYPKVCTYVTGYSVMLFDEIIFERRLDTVAQHP